MSVGLAARGRVVSMTDHTANTPVAPEIVDAARFRERLSSTAAVEALHAMLANGFDPADDLQRRHEDLAHGSMLLMPSEGPSHAGIKVLTVAPENPERGLELIQGSYLLFAADTLALTHIIDGPALTDLRTPAMTMTAIRPALSRLDKPLRAAVFGAGHQGRAHAQALREMCATTPGIESITAVVRQPDAVEDDVFTDVIRAGSPEQVAALREADVVLCATPAAEPLFDSTVLKDAVIVAAVGSHTPDARELDAALLARADVIVEDRATALREGGDVILAVAEGALTEETVVTIADVITGRFTPDATRPYVFKGTGMPWQDLAVAAAYAAPEPEGCS